MSSYRPITNNRRASAADKVISIEKLPFESAPALSFLNSYEETITAVPVFYDPFKPELTNAAPVSYNITRTINTLSDRTVALRHNGNTVDMEISVDSYTYIPQEPIVAPYESNPTLPKIRQGDFYNRSTTTYIYADIEVPKASNKIWDGRYSRCVDLQGYDVPNGNRLPEVIAEVQLRLDNPTDIYTVLPISGMATTVSPPKKDPYAATYKVRVQQFIATHYNSLALTRHPKGKAETDLYQELPQEGGDKKFTLQEGFVAAVLDGPYFVRWANVYRYADTALDADDDCGHKIVDYDKDGDAVIVLGHLCGLEQPELDSSTLFTNTFNVVEGFVAPGFYSYYVDIPSSVIDSVGSVSALEVIINNIQTSADYVTVSNVTITDLPYSVSGPFLITAFYDSSGGEPFYLSLSLDWTNNVLAGVNPPVNPDFSCQNGVLAGPLVNGFDNDITFQQFLSAMVSFYNFVGPDFTAAVTYKRINLSDSSWTTSGAGGDQRIINSLEDINQWEIGFDEARYFSGSEAEFFGVTEGYYSFTTLGAPYPIDSYLSQLVYYVLTAPPTFECPIDINIL